MAWSKRRHRLNKSQVASIIYHDIFDYPLTFDELKKWRLNTTSISDKLLVIENNNFYCLKGREGIISKRLGREKYSQKKLAIAKRAAERLAKIPTIEMVAITGSLAMNNARAGSDIDLMIITKKNSLWTTRFFSFILLRLAGFKLRRSASTRECDRLCINIWMDESDLVLKERNIFTAHELAQIIPLVDKGGVYEKLLTVNKWVFDYWPKASPVQRTKGKVQSKKNQILCSLVEPFAYWIQKYHMRNKITNETITKTRAFFHPVDLSKKVLFELDKRGL